MVENFLPPPPNENNQNKPSMAKVMQTFRDSQAPSRVSVPWTDVLAEPPLPVVVSIKKIQLDKMKCWYDMLNILHIAVIY